MLQEPIRLVLQMEPPRVSGIKIFEPERFAMRDSVFAGQLEEFLAEFHKLQLYRTGSRYAKRKILREVCYWSGYAGRRLRAFRQKFSNAPDLAVGGTKLFFNALVTPVDMIDAVDDSLAFGNQRGDHQ